MKTLIIDNYDSFTYNLFQLVAAVNGEEPLVITHDEFRMHQLLKLQFDNIIISPGPGHPDKASDFGICRDVLQQLDVPILGICLGHQGLCSVFGGKVVQAPIPMHGQTSCVRHFGDALFENIPKEFKVVRYHSLMVDQSLPDCLQAIAITEPNLIMAVRHREKPFWGVQYHPESVCSEYGEQLLINFNQLTQQYHRSQKTLRVLQKKITHVAQFKKMKCPSTPDIVFHHLFQNKSHVVWLDSSLVNPEISRFSLIGSLDGPLSYALEYDVKDGTVLQHQADAKQTFKMGIFDYLQEALQNININKLDVPFEFQGGFVGYLGYELYADTLPIKLKHQSPFPDAQLLFLDRVMVYDHQEHEWYILAISLPSQTEHSKVWIEEMSEVIASIHLRDILMDTEEQKAIHDYELSRERELYLKNIHDCMTQIARGESYEICLTNKLKFKNTVDAYAYYRRLRRINPSPYAAFLKFPGLSIACSSIERFLAIDAQGYVETKPIKGTMPRGQTPDEDLRNRQVLAQNIKFKSENMMIVDLLRNDLGKVCEIGSVHVPKLMQVESYSSVHQLVSTIRGKLRTDKTPIDCIKAAFPGGSMTGAPKIRTIEILQQYENEARGIYSGAIGFLSLNGSIDLNIVIRTAVITENELSIGVGGAIIALSDPEEEFDEMLLKSKFLRKALSVNDSLLF